MGKADFGTAKYQSKQLKASGLQKLRYYCQICEKQCRDANGFKNHLLSPSHTGRISNLSKDGKARSVVEQYLSQFEGDFLKLLRINHGTKKINANKFYQEYILNDKNHVHMNATRWNTLTSFIKYLGRTGKARVEVPEDADDEFNLLISLIDHLKLNTKESREKDLISDEYRANNFIQMQIAKGKELLSTPSSINNDISDASSQSSKANVAKPVSLSLKGLSKARKITPAAFDNDSDEDE